MMESTQNIQEQSQSKDRNFDVIKKRFMLKTQETGILSFKGIEMDSMEIFDSYFNPTVVLRDLRLDTNKSGSVKTIPIMQGGVYSQKKGNGVAAYSEENKWYQFNSTGLNNESYKEQSRSKYEFDNFKKHGDLYVVQECADTEGLDTAIDNFDKHGAIVKESTEVLVNNNSIDTNFVEMHAKDIQNDSQNMNGKSSNSKASNKHKKFRRKLYTRRRRTQNMKSRMKDASIYTFHEDDSIASHVRLSQAFPKQTVIPSRTNISQSLRVKSKTLISHKKTQSAEEPSDARASLNGLDQPNSMKKLNITIPDDSSRAPKLVTPIPGSPCLSKRRRKMAKPQKSVTSLDIISVSEGANSSAAADRLNDKYYPLNSDGLVISTQHPSLLAGRGTKRKRAQPKKIQSDDKTDIIDDLEIAEVKMTSATQAIPENKILHDYQPINSTRNMKSKVCDEPNVSKPIHGETNEHFPALTTTKSISVAYTKSPNFIPFPPKSSVELNGKTVVTPSQISHIPAPTVAAYQVPGREVVPAATHMNTSSDASGNLIVSASMGPKMTIIEQKRPQSDQGLIVDAETDYGLPDDLLKIQEQYEKQKKELDMLFALSWQKEREKNIIGKKTRETFCRMQSICDRVKGHLKGEETTDNSVQLNPVNLERNSNPYLNSQSKMPDIILDSRRPNQPPKAHNRETSVKVVVNAVPEAHSKPVDYSRYSVMKVTKKQEPPTFESSHNTKQTLQGQSFNAANSDKTVAPQIINEPNASTKQQITPNTPEKPLNELEKFTVAKIKTMSNSDMTIGTQRFVNNNELNVPRSSIGPLGTVVTSIGAQKVNAKQQILVTQPTLQKPDGQSQIKNIEQDKQQNMQVQYAMEMALLQQRMRQIEMELNDFSSEGKQSKKRKTGKVSSVSNCDPISDGKIINTTEIVNRLPLDNSPKSIPGIEKGASAIVNHQQGLPELPKQINMTDDRSQQGQDIKALDKQGNVPQNQLSNMVPMPQPVQIPRQQIPNFVRAPIVSFQQQTQIPPLPGCQPNIPGNQIFMQPQIPVPVPLPIQRPSLVQQGPPSSDGIVVAVPSNEISPYQMIIQPDGKILQVQMMQTGLRYQEVAVQAETAPIQKKQQRKPRKPRTVKPKPQNHETEKETDASVNKNNRENVEAPNDPKEISQDKPTDDQKLPPTIVCSTCRMAAQFVCSGCKMVAYCSMDCQAAAWKTHCKTCTGQKK